MEKVVLGISGGVDSAVSAYLLKEQGYEVAGVYLDVGTGGAEAAERASRDAGVSFMAIDVRERLERVVCAPFDSEYRAGRTPSPCVLCNAGMKFPSLLEAAELLDARWIATGHYARLREENGRCCLLKGEPRKDQSYMLGMLTQDILKKTIFPLGDLCKDEVRVLAREKGFFSASKPDSMEICFIPDGDYAAFLEKRGPSFPEGDFVDEEGLVIGRHRGIHRYTPGQRKGLGSAFGRPMFVLRVDAARNRVVLSEEKSLFVSHFRVRGLNCVSWPEIPAEAQLRVKVRHSRTEYPVRMVTGEDGTAEVFCESPVRAPAPGQAAAFYNGSYLVAAGWII